MDKIVVKIRAIVAVLPDAPCANHSRCFWFTPFDSHGIGKVGKGLGRGWSGAEHRRNDHTVETVLAGAFVVFWGSENLQPLSVGTPPHGPREAREMCEGREVARGLPSVNTKARVLTS